MKCTFLLFCLYSLCLLTFNEAYSLNLIVDPSQRTVTTTVGSLGVQLIKEWKDVEFTNKVMFRSSDTNGPELLSLDPLEKEKVRWMHFGGSNFLESIADNFHLINEKTFQQEGLSLSFYFRLTAAISATEKFVLFDNQKGFQIGIVPSASGDPTSANFGIISDVSKLDVYTVPFCVGAAANQKNKSVALLTPFLWDIRITYDDTLLKYTLKIYRMGRLVSSPDLTLNDTVLNSLLNTQNSTIRLGCPFSGTTNCFKGDLAFFHSGKSTSQTDDEAHALMEDYLSTYIKSANRCGDGQFSPPPALANEYCDPSTVDHSKACTCGCELTCKDIETELTNTDKYSFKKEIQSNGATDVIVTCNQSNSYYPTRALSSQRLICGLHEAGIWPDITLPCARSCDLKKEEWYSEINTLYKVSDEGLFSSQGIIQDGDSVTISCAFGLSPPEGSGSSQTLVCSDAAVRQLRLECMQECKIPAPVKNIDFIGSGTRERSVIQAKCKTGTRPEAGSPSQQNLMCVKGSFTPLYLSCLEDCAPFTLSAVSKEVASNASERYLFLPVEALSTRVPSGSVVEISCIAPYTYYGQTDNSVTKSTCRDGKWTAVTISCTKGCNPFKSSDSSVDWFPKSYTNDIVPFNSEVTISCNTAAGFYPDSTWADTNPSSTIKCIGDNWSPSLLSCRKACTALPDLSRLSEYRMTTSNLVTIASSISSTSPPFRHGSTVTYTCANGFSMDSVSDNGGGDTMCVDGVWTKTLLSCLPNCPAFPIDQVLSDKAYQLSVVTKDQVLNDLTLRVQGASITISCAENAVPVSGISSQALTCSNGAWSIMTLRCGLNCGDFTALSLPKYLITGSGNLNGSTRTVRCNVAQSYQVISGSEPDTVFCKNGSWTLPSLICGKDCGFWVPPSPPERYVLVNSTAPMDAMTTKLNPHGSFAKYQCETTKFSPEAGDLTIAQTSVCDEGVWSALPLNCLANCPAVENENPDRFADPVEVSTGKGNRHGAQYSTKCKNGLSPSIGAGSETTTCIDGAWSPKTMSCYFPCGDWPNDYQETDNPLPRGMKVVSVTKSTLLIQTAKKSSSLLPHGSKTSLVCVDKFDNIAERSDGLTASDPADSRCSDGHWSITNIDCREQCPPLTDILEMDRYRLNPSVPDVKHGTSVSVGCNDNFSPLRGPSNDTVTCVDGVWTPLSLVCVKNCQPLPLDEEGFLVTPPQGSLQHGDVRVVSCIRDPATATPPFTAPWKYGYYDANGANSQSIVCDDGQWSSLSILCVRKCPPLLLDETAYVTSPNDRKFLGDPKNNPIAEAQFAHGAVRIVQCATGWSDPDSHLTQDLMRCSYGVWSEKKLKCKQQCPGDQFYRVDPNSYAIAPTLNRDIYYDHSSRFSVTCQKGNSQSPSYMEILSSQNGNATLAAEAMDAISSVSCVHGSYTSLGIRCYMNCLPYDDYDGERETVLPLSDEETVRDFEVATGMHNHLSSIIVTCKKNNMRDGTIATKLATQYAPAMIASNQTLTYNNKPPTKSNKLFVHNTYQLGEVSFQEPILYEQLTCHDGSWNFQSLKCRSDCPPLSFAQPERYIISAPDWVLEQNTTTNSTTNTTNTTSSATGNTTSNSTSNSTSTATTPLSLADIESKYAASLFHGASRVVTCNSEATPYPFFSAPQLRNGVLVEVPSITKRCSDGIWVGNDISCMKKCVSPTILVTAPEAYTFGASDYSHGSIVSVTCTETYAPRVGVSPATVICNDGEWSNLDLKCEKVCVPYSVWVTEGDPVVVTGCSSSEVEENSGLTAVGDSSIDTTPPAAAANSPATCPDRYIISGMTESSLPGSYINLSCALGTSTPRVSSGTPIASQRLTCYDGEWEGRFLECLRTCNRLPILQDADFLTELEDEAFMGDPYIITPIAVERFSDGSYRSMSVVKVQCNDTWQAIVGGPTEQDFYCLDGKWSPQQVFCLPRCKNFDTSQYKGMIATPSPYNRNEIKSIRGVALAPNGYEYALGCTTGYHMLPLQPLSTSTRCDKGSFSEPHFSCIPVCPVPLPQGLATNRAREMMGKSVAAYMLVNGDYSRTYLNGNEIIADGNGWILQHGGEYQLTCSKKSSDEKPYRVRPNPGGSQWMLLTTDQRLRKDSGHFFTTGFGMKALISAMSIVYSPALMGAALLGMMLFAPISSGPQPPGFTHTSGLIQYYGFFCDNCGITGTTLRMVSRSSTFHGPYKRVQCWYGKWTDDTFSCTRYKDVTPISPVSTRCVMCSRAWREGRLADQIIYLDNQAGRFLPRIFMKGYHQWAKYAMRVFDGSPSIQAFGERFFVVPIAYSMASLSQFFEAISIKSSLNRLFAQNKSNEESSLNVSAVWGFVMITLYSPVALSSFVVSEIGVKMGWTPHNHREEMAVGSVGIVVYLSFVFVVLSLLIKSVGRKLGRRS